MTDADRKAPLPKPEPVGAPTPNTVLLVLTNVPDAQTGERIAKTLVEEHLAACVNVMAPCTSIYRWQGEIEQAVELPVLIKTAQDRFAKLQQRLIELHPYELPEILSWRPTGGSQAYASWVIGQTRAPRTGAA